MRVGIDFDNTLVCYDDIFHRVAVEKGLIPKSLAANKVQVKEFIRRSGNEHAWTKLQGYIYGARMVEARPYPGAIGCIKRLMKGGHELFIVSHKTTRPFLGFPYDLHEAARTWILEVLNSPEVLIQQKNIFFEPTKEEKISRINELCCDVFLDDLPEILCDPLLKSTVKKVLFSFGQDEPEQKNLLMVRSWDEFLRAV